MKTILATAFALAVLQSSQLFAQTTIRANEQKFENETMQNPYLKNRWDNKKTSAPFFEQRIVEGDTVIVSIRTMQVNVNDAASNIVDDAGNEPSIAIDINDTLHIAIGWRQFDNIASNFRQAGWSYSSDGGLTWNMSIIDEGVFRSDPVLDYDLQGNFYYNSLTPYPDWECDVYKSTDGGATWDEGTYAYGGDKQWMAIDRTNGAGSGNIYAIWSADYSACVPGNFTRSTDGNLSYESCDHVEAEPYYGMPAVDADGYLYVVGGGTSSTLTVTRSLNAQIPGATIEWDDPVNVDLDGSLSGWQDINPEGLIGQANIDIDRSGGPGHGNIYVLAPVDPYTGPDDADISFAKSTDGGLTWSDPIWINDDKNDGNTHWFGTMSVAPNGRIDVIWLHTPAGGGGAGCPRPRGAVNTILVTRGISTRSRGIFRRMTLFRFTRRRRKRLKGLRMGNLAMRSAGKINTYKSGTMGRGVVRRMSTEMKRIASTWSSDITRNLFPMCSSVT